MLSIQAIWDRAPTRYCIPAKPSLLWQTKLQKPHLSARKPLLSPSSASWEPKGAPRSPSETLGNDLRNLGAGCVLLWSSAELRRRGSPFLPINSFESSSRSRPLVSLFFPLCFCLELDLFFAFPGLVRVDNLPRNRSCRLFFDQKSNLLEGLGSKDLIFLRSRSSGR